MTAAQVVPRMKPDIEPCVCGCGVVNRPKVKPFKDGLGPHARGCICSRCRGRNVKRTSGNRERRIARRLGGERAPLSGALSGWDIRVPLRGGVSLCIEESVAVAHSRWWNGKTMQRKVARLMALSGVLRAFRGSDVTTLPNEDFDALVALAQEDDR